MGEQPPQVDHWTQNYFHRENHRVCDLTLECIFWSWVSACWCLCSGKHTQMHMGDMTANSLSLEKDVDYLFRG